MIKTYQYVLGFMVAAVVVIIVWNTLPVEIKRYHDIKLGNTIVINLEKYKMQNKELPRTGDWEVLRSIGFEARGEGTWPTYEKTSNNTYKLIYLQGFDGPYLTYDSDLKAWKMK